MSTPLFYDPATRQGVNEEQLQAAVVGARILFAPMVRPVDASEAVLALLRAVVLGEELTLVDSDLSDAELRSLGITAEALGERREVTGLRLEDDWLHAARSAAGFRLTLHTSGTTGLPKRVTHGLEALTRSLRTGSKHAGNVWGLAYSPTHIAGVQVILQAFFNRNPLVHLFRVPQDACVRAIREHGITHLSGTPSFYRTLLSAAEPMPGVRAVALGGERSDPALIERLRALFPGAKIRNFYASTEAGTLLMAEGDVFEVPEAVADSLRISDGMLEVHRSHLGFFDREEGTLEWYRTGDRVEIVTHAPLRFRILGREGQAVNVGGHKVNLEEVEAALAACPGILGARVYGRPNSVLGNVLCAEVITEGEFSEPAVRVWLAERLQPAKIPRVIRRVEALPITRSGKLDRRGDG